MSKQFKVGDEVLVEAVVSEVDSPPHEAIRLCVGLSSMWSHPSKIYPMPPTPACEPAHPTAPQVAQAAEVYAGMERERLQALAWASIFGAYLTKTGKAAEDIADAADLADWAMREFDKRFGKGGA